MALVLFKPCKPVNASLGPLKADDIVIVNGTASHCGFEINLEADNGDIPFHFERKAGACSIVRNSKISGCWGCEETHGGYPFADNKRFEISIRVEAGCYQVAVNGNRFFDYNHRIPFGKVTKIHVCGSWDVEAVSFYPAISPSFLAKPFKNGASGELLEFNPVIPQGSPWYAPIDGGLLYNRVIRVTGVATGDRFNINLLSGIKKGDDFVLHIDVRFKTDYERNVVVLNSFINGEWGERTSNNGCFSFTPKAKFDVAILCEASSFKIAVNGQPYWDYPYRLPLTNIKYVSAELEAQLSSVRIM